MSLVGVRRGVQWGLEFLGRAQALPMLGLLSSERAEFEAVLGASVELVANADAYHQRWLITRRETREESPTLTWDPARGVLTSLANTPAEFATTLNLLHTLAHSCTNRVAETLAPDPGAAFDRIYTEVANTYPGFTLRGLDWEHISHRHRGVRELHGEDFLLGVQRWIAELGDAHTAACRPATRFHPPYRATMSPTGAQLTAVPPGSAAHQAGVRAGWMVEVADPTWWLRCHGATPQQHAQVAARAFLAMTEPQRAFTAHDRHGNHVRWVETATTSTLQTTLRWRHERDHTHIWLRSFDGSLDLATAFDTLLTQARARHNGELVLDLRGNTGGSLRHATALRDRFLRARTRLGSIAFTTGTGQLADPVTLTGEPSDAIRWPGLLTVLVDAMTYSAAEDFLLGLQGLDHVRVLGEPTGGGSGRPRTLRITPELTLTISTALTYDRQQRCVELNGIPVDGPPPEDRSHRVREGTPTEHTRS